MDRRRLVPRLAAAFALVFVVCGLRAPEPAPADPEPETCAVCSLWDRYEKDLDLAEVEAGALEKGAVYFIYASTFAEVEQIQRFAYERRRLEEAPESRIHARHRGMDAPGALTVEVTTSARGFFAVLTSNDPAVVRFLHEEASYAVRSRRPPRF